MSIYIFTVRRARLDNKSKYVGMIPKLFSNLYNEDEDLTETYLQEYRERLKGISQNHIFEDLIHDKDNILWRSQYLTVKDKKKISNINVDVFSNDRFTNVEFIRLIEHLYRGHQTMEYGVYFGCKKAVNDIEFMEGIKHSHITDKDQRIVYYTKLDTLIEYINEQQKKYYFDSPILYFNVSWQYGIKEDTSMNYEQWNRNKSEFIDYINSFDNKQLMLSEIVCQLPLPVELFKFTYKQQGGLRGFSNIITVDNVEQHYGRLVQVRLVHNYDHNKWSQPSRGTGDGPFDLSDDRVDENAPTRIADLTNSVFRLVEMNPDNPIDKEYFPMENVVRLNRAGNLNEGWTNEYPYFLEIPDYIDEWLTHISYGGDHIGYYIELYNPYKRDFFTKRHADNVMKNRAIQVFDKYRFGALMKSNLYRPPTKYDSGGPMYKRMKERFYNTVPGQVGGVRIPNIITVNNVQQHYGKLVKVKLTNNYNTNNYSPYNELGVYEFDDNPSIEWIQLGPYDLNGEYFVRNETGNEPVEGTSNRINGMINTVFRLEKLDRNDQQIYPDINEDNIRNIVKLINNNNIHYLEIPPNVESFINTVRLGVDHIGYYIELYDPLKPDFFTKGHLRNIRNNKDKQAFTELATSRKLREFPPDLKAQILSKMNVNEKINPTKINTIGGKKSNPCFPPKGSINSPSCIKAQIRDNPWMLEDNNIIGKGPLLDEINRIKKKRIQKKKRTPKKRTPKKRTPKKRTPKKQIEL